MEYHVIKEFVSLSYVKIKSCGIKSLDGCITGLTKLKHLTIQDCVALEHLPTDINTLVSLEDLCIEGCTSINSLPNIAALYNLQFLSFKGCSTIDEFHADFDKLTNLCSLELTNTNVQSLPSTIIKLPYLTNIFLPGCFRFETLPNDFDLEVIKIYIPLSFKLDTLPAKFSVMTLDYAYQLHLKDQKESSLEIINDEESYVDVANESEGYGKTMVNTPPNLTHLPQPCPGHFHCNVVGETSGYASENGHTGLKPSDHNVFVKSRKQRKEITLEDIQQCISSNMTLENAAAGLCGPFLYEQSLAFVAYRI